MYVESGEPGGSWSLEPIPGVTLADIDFTSLAAAGDTLHAVWGLRYEDPQRLRYASWAAGDGWSAPVDLLADLPVEMRPGGNAHLAVSSTGEVMLVRTQEPGLLIGRIRDGRLTAGPELVVVDDSMAGCGVLSRPVFDARDRLALVAYCRVPDTEPDEYFWRSYVVRGGDSGWQVAEMPSGGPGSRVALGPDGTVYIAYQGSVNEASSSPVAACEEDVTGCFVTSADGTSFTEPRELPGLGQLGLRSRLPDAMVARGDGVVLVDCLGDGEGGCQQLVVTSLER